MCRWSQADPCLRVSLGLSCHLNKARRHAHPRGKGLARVKWAADSSAGTSDITTEPCFYSDLFGGFIVVNTFVRLKNFGPTVTAKLNRSFSLPGWQRVRLENAVEGTKCKILVLTLAFPTDIKGRLRL